MVYMGSDLIANGHLSHIKACSSFERLPKAIITTAGSAVSVKLQPFKCGHKTIWKRSNADFRIRL